MIDYVLTPFFAGAMTVALILIFLIHRAAKHYNKKASERKMKSEFLRTPINNTLTVISLLLPTLAALSAFLYTKYPAGNYSRIVSVIAVLLFALIIAIWETFALLKKANTLEEITLKLPDDLYFITGLGVIYAYLIMSLVLLVWFFLFDLPKPTETSENKVSAAHYYIEKPQLHIGDLRCAVKRAWGTHTEGIPSQHVLRYVTPDSNIDLAFDAHDKLERITETRR